MLRQFDPAAGGTAIGAGIDDSAQHPDTTTSGSAATAPGSDPKRVRLRSCRRTRRNSPRDLASVALPIELKIEGVAFHLPGTKRWMTLFSRPMLDRDNWALSDHKPEICCSLLVGSSTRGLAADFGHGVVEMVRAVHPNVLRRSGGHRDIVTAFEITVFRKSDGPLMKQISLMVRGSL